MPQVGGVTDFGADFARGAAVGNMQVQQRERMIELQGQEALRMVQERHLAAQADAIANKLQEAQAEKVKEDQDLATADLVHKTLTETIDPGDKSPEEVSSMATKATDDWLVQHNPALARKVGRARTALAATGLSQEKLQTQEDIATTRAGAQLGVQGLRNQGGLDRQDAKNAGALDVQQLRNEGGMDRQQLRNTGNLDVAKVRADHLAVADEGYKRAVASGDVDLANDYLKMKNKLTTSSHTQPLDPESIKEIGSIFKQVDALNERIDRCQRKPVFFQSRRTRKERHL